MIWVIIVAVIVFIAFKIGSTSGQVVGSMNNIGSNFRIGRRRVHLICRGQALLPLFWWTNVPRLQQSRFENFRRGNVV